MAPYNHYTIDEKRQIIERFRRSNLSQAKFARQEGVPHRTLQNWLKNEHCLSKPRRIRKADHPLLETELNAWIQSERAMSRVLRHSDIVEKALQIAKREGFDKFKASPGWLNQFKKRFRLAYREISRDHTKRHAVTKNWYSKRSMH
ncbi:hypothetical protein BV898_11995 [Hypsibius exemplaris]|uniref:HTH CENPB-type domain-containing protein n=1 Tax=Hypsibius exemplaris TaxID=2072580 RepID=A0A1W0WEZ1_HYPEX|nr:hypothetical protein BV898_11995 [Hypsibius exemplaris]